MTLCKYYQIQCQDCDFRSSYYPNEQYVEDMIAGGIFDGSCGF